MWLWEVKWGLLFQILKFILNYYVAYDVSVISPNRKLLANTNESRELGKYAEVVNNTCKPEQKYLFPWISVNASAVAVGFL